jgi:DNA-directed RNA polymerase subunit RPC12/RpoP
MISYSCPCCESIFNLPYSEQDCYSATVDCPNCDTLLLLKESPNALDFHSYLNQQDSRWPSNGIHTEYANV